MQVSVCACNSFINTQLEGYKVFFTNSTSKVCRNLKVFGEVSNAFVGLVNLSAESYSMKGETSASPLASLEPSGLEPSPPHSPYIASIYRYMCYKMQRIEFDIGNCQYVYELNDVCFP